MKTCIKIIVLSIFTFNTALNFKCFAKIECINRTEPKAITIETVGKGLPILFLPGFATPGSVFKDTANHINTAHSSLFVSYAGFNGHAPIEMPWYDTIKKAIIAYITTEKLNNVIIIGHSMGGNLAVDIAAALPNTISKIIIVDALPCMREVMMPQVPAEHFYYESPYNTQMLNMEVDQFKSMAKMMAMNMTINTDNQDAITNWMINADRKTWVYGYTDLLKLDLRPTLKDVSCETLILGASFPDVIVAKQNYEKQYANLTNKTIQMASNSKHFVMFDQPEWFYKSVNDFLVDEN
ncbi:alpha/beta fold hydrolase [Formosa algae]|uniref:Pimeloyl-ACP methyl ester carboxylesterase n=1 Tax=Formosa algae TaxID=225843 RepID=A0A9X0YPA5_9FLAO|nr:alpha/beta hydrolase [Formosa algae]MBP1840666.1 pimeloyl-ACP methyl ester carboxylesterase [Formosa algae]MDQ0335921.1 pimeloyl-ACP methyl ester carboxylesterase [Formosa algae]